MTVEPVSRAPTRLDSIPTIITLREKKRSSSSKTYAKYTNPHNHTEVQLRKHHDKRSLFNPLMRAYTMFNKRRLW